jgi:hypothetical protein
MVAGIRTIEKAINRSLKGQSKRIQARFARQTRLEDGHPQGQRSPDMLTFDASLLSILSTSTSWGRTAKVGIPRARLEWA